MPNIFFRSGCIDDQLRSLFYLGKSLLAHVPDHYFGLTKLLKNDP